MNISFSKENKNANLRVISLGAGVQSSVMALMAKMGEIKPMPDCAIFADTMDEPEEVYEHLYWLKKILPFEVYIVSKNNMPLSDALISLSNKDTKNGVLAPLHSIDKRMSLRHCTRAYKIEPIRNKIRQLLNVKKGEKVSKDIIVEQWIGISTDELQRVKFSNVKYIENRFPLIEIGMNRNDCINFFNKNFKRKLPRSACVYCPFKRNDEWRYLRDNDVKGWKKAIKIDEKLRLDFHGKEQFVHQSRVPLKDADLSTAEDRGQLNFLDECEGMCGV
tara:strand:+ start:235 stop:1062 length:828 start_codon:yes stop_codon:yes gene_type:complete